MLLLCVMAGLSTTTKRAGLTCNSLRNLHRPFEIQLKKFPDSEHREKSCRITRDFFFAILFLRTEIAILRLYFILLNAFFIRRQSSYYSKAKSIAFA